MTDAGIAEPSQHELMSDVLKIDCYGRPWLDEVSVQVGSQSVWFAWKPQLKVGQDFHLAMFQDRSAVHRCVFRYPWHRRLAVLTESPVEPYFARFHQYESHFPQVLTHDGNLLQRGERYERLLYGTSFIPDAKPPASKLKNCSFMGSIEHEEIAGYTLRRQVAQELQDRDDIDCFGRGIQPVDSKESALAPYRFSVAMENTQHDYYFSEKLIDCFLVETVPIYWGPPSISEFFDDRGILCFDTIDELRDIVHRIDETLYQQMLPYVRLNAQRARQMKLASYEQMHERIAEHIVARMQFRSTIGNLQRSRVAAGFRQLVSRIC